MAHLAVTSGDVEEIGVVCQTSIGECRDVEQMVQELFKTYLPQLTKIVKEFTDMILGVVDEAVRNIVGIGEKRLRITLEAKAVCRELLTVMSNFGAFMAKVNTFALHARDEERKADILDALRKEEPDLTPMNEYFDHLRRCMDRALKSYDKFEDHCLNVQKSLSDVHEECKDTASKAGKYQVGTQAVGGAAAGGAMLAGLGGSAAVVATGVCLSVAAGVPTLGIGAIIGLAITGVTAPVVGIGIGGTVAGATYVLAKEYKGHKVALECLAKYLGNLGKDASYMKQKARNIQQLFESISETMEDVEYYRKKRSSLLASANELFKELTKFASTTSEINDKMTVKIENLETSIHEIIGM